MNPTPLKRTLLALAVAAAHGQGLAQAQEAGAAYTAPQRPPLQHYLDALRPSPFTLEVIDQPTAAPPSFAANLVLKGFHTIGGEQTVAYGNLKTGQSAYLKGDEPNADGIRLVKLSIERDRSKTEALIAKGAEVAVIRPSPTAAPAKQAPGTPQAPAPSKLTSGQEAEPLEPTTLIRRRRIILPGQTNAG